jgi:thiamine biosynthesis lipoprotein
MTTVTLARHAMATRFELVLHGANEVALQAAGEEALEEISRLEAQLSLYRSTSEMARVNARAAREPVRVEPAFFRLLQQAQRLHQESGGAFDVTIGPLMRCWGFVRDTGRFPTSEELAEARANVGMHLVELDPKEFTVRFARPGVMLDLGAIGKGYAIERAVEILREDGVTSALLHGGTSTVHALGQPPNGDVWKVAIEFSSIADAAASYPLAGVRPSSAAGASPRAAASGTANAAPASVVSAPEDGRTPSGDSVLLSAVPLRDEALSVSAVWGKAFQSDEKIYGHVIDPRTGQPADNAMLAAVVVPSATEADALSTALLTLGREGLGQLGAVRPGARLLVAGRAPGAGKLWVEAKDIEPLEA